MQFVKAIVGESSLEGYSTHNHTASGAGAVLTPSTGLGLDSELSAPSSFSVVGTVGPSTQSESTARMPHSHTHCCSKELVDTLKDHVTMWAVWY